VVFVHRSEPSLYVFVNAGHFADRVSPSAVIVNNTTIINKTTEINDVKRETRTFGGASAQRVVINRGPSVAMVQEASGRPIAVTPIHDAVKRTPEPPPMKNGNLQPTGRDIPNGPGQPKPDVKQPVIPGKAPHAPGKGEPGSNDRGQEHGHGHDKGSS
jgi:hypothetical protein